MGKGDKKSKKGKIATGSYGNSRRRKQESLKVAVVDPKPIAEVKSKTKAKK
jgi:ribosomal small subunit protein bTHX